MNQDHFQEEILIEKRGPLGVLTLNRPQSLNALNLEMIRLITGTLRQWEKDDTVKAVLFLGTGDRAFCSGGDIKGFYRIGMDYRCGRTSLKVASLFFAEEYALDRQIFHYPKSTIAMMNGIVMGGGFGIGGNCSHRIVTEKTIFAMPETGIGFYPDVGSIYHLSRAPKNYGRYLALTGARVNGADMIRAKLADYFVSSAKQQEMVQAMVAGGDIGRVIAQYKEKDTSDGIFEKNAALIKKSFKSLKVEKIKKALEKDGSQFAKDTLALITQRSPTSVLVTAEHMRRAKRWPFDKVIGADFILTQRFMERGDFYEGIRAAVIDKDRNPQWNPGVLAEVSANDLKAYFAPTGHNLENIAGVKE